MLSRAPRFGPPAVITCLPRVQETKKKNDDLLLRINLKRRRTKSPERSPVTSSPELSPSPAANAMEVEQASDGAVPH